MTWLRRTLGLDAVDLLIHFGVTAALLGFVAMENGPEGMLPVIVGLSLVVLSVRRSIALRSAERRGLTTGEMAAERIAELEERLDFAERLLAQTSAEPRAPGRLQGARE